MSIRIMITCDGCQIQREEGNLVYCRDCYLELEDEVKELEKEIEALKAKSLNEVPGKQKEQPFLFPTKEEAAEEDQDPDCPF
ncbi:hypothetical protein ES707_19387 [subsurface metagenome]